METWREHLCLPDGSGGGGKEAGEEYFYTKNCFLEGQEIITSGVEIQQVEKGK